VLPDAIDDTFGDREAVIGLSTRLAPEDVQLYYQIGLIGRRDLALAPDPRGGFEMVMLRMLAFRPQSTGEAAAAPSASSTPTVAGTAAPRKVKSVAPSREAPETAAEVVREAVPEPVPEAVPATVADPASDDWLALVERLDIKGMARELALNCALQELTEQAAVLAVDPTHARLLSETRRQQIEQALGGHFGRPFSLKILQEGEFRGETPARRQAREREARKQQAVQSIETDENVKALQDAFGATVNYDSIRPREE